MGFIKKISWLRYAGKTGKFYNSKQYDKALVCAERALKLAEEEYSPEHLNVNRALYNMVVVHRAKKQYEKAIEYGERAIQITEKNRGKYDIAVIEDLKNILRVYEDMEYSDKIKEINDRIAEIENEQHS